MSGGAALRSRKVSPTFSPVNERTGKVLSSALMARGLVVGVLKEMGLNVEMGLSFWCPEAPRKTEEEKKESEEGVVAEEAIEDEAFFSE